MGNSTQVDHSLLLASLGDRIAQLNTLCSNLQAQINGNSSLIELLLSNVNGINSSGLHTGPHIKVRMTMNVNTFFGQNASFADLAPTGSGVAQRIITIDLNQAGVSAVQNMIVPVYQKTPATFTTADGTLAVSDVDLKARVVNSTTVSVAIRATNWQGTTWGNQVASWEIYVPVISGIQVIQPASFEVTNTVIVNGVLNTFFLLQYL